MKGFRVVDYISSTFPKLCLRNGCDPSASKAKFGSVDGANRSAPANHQVRAAGSGRSTPQHLIPLACIRLFGLTVLPFRSSSRVAV